MEDQERFGNLAEHIRAWGGWVLAHARRELREFYPVVDGQTPLTYLWARTVLCPDPQCGTEVPLLKTFWLSKVAGRRAALRIIPDSAPASVHFEIWYPKDGEEAEQRDNGWREGYLPSVWNSDSPLIICESRDFAIEWAPR